MIQSVCAFALMLAVSVPVLAQTRSSVEIGYLNGANVVRFGNETDRSDALNGFYIGANYEYPLVAGLSIRPGLQYAYLTDRSQDEMMGFKLTGSVNEHYINVPVRLQYGFDVLPSLRIAAFTGPVFSVGLAGNLRMDLSGSLLGNDLNGMFKYDYFSGKVSSENLPENIVNELNKAMGEGQYHRFDIQYGVGLSVVLMDRFELRGGYDWGLLNRLKNADGQDAKSRRDQFYVSLAFRF